MNERSIFIELGTLGCRLPGVSVSSTDLLPTGFSMTLVIIEAASVGVIVFCANAANIP
jgi:hypothetical protein